MTVNTKDIIPLFHILKSDASADNKGCYIYYDGHVYNQDKTHNHTYLYLYENGRLSFSDISLKIDISTIYEFDVHEYFSEKLLNTTIEKLIFNKI